MELYEAVTNGGLWMELLEGIHQWSIVDGTVWGQWPMEVCGWNCLRAMTTGALWKEMSEGSDQ